MTEEELLGAFEALLRTQPERAVLRHGSPETLDWFGRAVALISQWSLVHGEVASGLVDRFHGPMPMDGQHAYTQLMVLINRAIHDLRMKTVGPVNAALGAGQVFHYFDAVRQVIAAATADVLFVDQYLDAEFVGRYLPLIRPGVAIRLLTGDRVRYLDALRPAVQLFNRQHGANAVIRSAAGFHDRYVFIDGAAAYQSGASFKDGAVNAPTTLTQITDAFAAVRDTYERIWASAQQV